MYNVDLKSVKALVPNGKGEYIAAFFEPNPIFEKYHLDNRLRVCHFFAQILAETGGFRVFEESLNYTAVRLTQVWPKHFPDIESAEPYAHNEEALGNYIYGNKIHPDLGNTEPGDGYRFRGRGLLQTTGRSAYKKYGDLLEIPLVEEPNLVYDHRYSLSVAAVEFSKSTHDGVSTLVLSDRDDIVGVTYAVNGGQTGIEQRRSWLRRAKAAFVAPDGEFIAPVVGDISSRAAANSGRVAST